MVAEWLRRLTRNQMGYARTGSNPVHDGSFSYFVLFSTDIMTLSGCCSGSSDTGGRYYLDVVHVLLIREAGTI